jgi:predicted XRE-type DNA-binding protein
VTKSAIERSSGRSKRNATTTGASKPAATTKPRRRPEPETLQLAPEIEAALAKASTLADRARKNSRLAAKTAAKAAEFEREYELEKQIERVMEAQHVNRKQLADRLGVERSSISRDLNRGFSRASISRISQIAGALHCRFVPVLVPKDDKAATAAQLARMMSSLDITIDDLRKATA